MEPHLKKNWQNRNSPIFFALFKAIGWLFQLLTLTYTKDQTVQPGTEKTRQKSIDINFKYGKDPTFIVGFLSIQV